MPPSCALFGGFAISARVALLWQHYENAWQSPAVIRQAHSTPHALRMRVACGKDSPHRRRSISSLLWGVVTRTRNVSEYMLVLALCLVMLLLPGILNLSLTTNRTN